jgi:hypothetical protein
MASIVDTAFKTIEYLFRIASILILILLSNTILQGSNLLDTILHELLSLSFASIKYLSIFTCIYATIEIAYLAMCALFKLLKTIGLNAIYNALKLTTYILSAINVLMFIGWYIHFKYIVNECTYYFNHYHLFQESSWLIKYFPTYDTSKYYYCENNKTIMIWSATMMIFVISLYVLLGAIKIVKLFL